MVILLAFNPCGPEWAHRGIPASARGRARRGEGNCKSIYIRSRRAYDKFASTLSLFGRMATWRRATLYNNDYFKGLNILLVGDFYQLPPVG